MIKRILSSIGPGAGLTGSLEWSVQLAKAHQASLTVVPLIDPDSWKQDIPPVIAAGYAARLLEQRPWDAPPVRMHDLELRCQAVCREAGVECTMSEPAHDPYAWTANLWRYHDLLVVDNHPARISEFLDRGLSPILAVPRETFSVDHVLTVCSDSIESARALKQFLHVRPWPEASLELIYATRDPRQADSLLSAAARYCRAHGRNVNLTHLEGEAGNLPDYLNQRNSSLVVAAHCEPGIERGRGLLFLAL
jgi:hypothetical protein